MTRKQEGIFFGVIVALLGFKAIGVWADTSSNVATEKLLRASSESYRRIIVTGQYVGFEGCVESLHSAVDALEKARKKGRF